MSKKSIIAVFIFTVLAFAGIAYYSASSSAKNTNTYVNPAFKEFIVAYTAGYVSVESKITIVLQNETSNEVEIGKEVENNLFEFSPNIKGHITWIDKKTVEFKPTERLENDQTYKVSFSLGNIMSVSNEFKNFEFEFRTLKQAIEVSIDEYIAVGDNQLELSGTLALADVSTNEAIEKTILAKQQGNNLPIKWIHENSTNHHFIVSQIIKGNGTVSFSYNGESVGAEEKNTQELMIPKQNEFILLKTVVTNEPDQFITLQFSDKLDANQSLEGLISIDGVLFNQADVAKAQADAMAAIDSAVSIGADPYYQAAQATEIANKMVANNKKLTFLIENNTIKIYTAERYIDVHELAVSAALKNSKGNALGTEIKQSVLFEDLKPNVKLVGKGVILPASNNLLFPFEAVNLSAVDIRITRIYENNMLQFLQVNGMDGSQDLRRVGKLLLKRKIDLNKIGSIGKNRWNKYALDLSTLIQTEPGALYNVRISFNKKYSTYACSDTSSTPEVNEGNEYGDYGMPEESDVTNTEEEKDWDYYGYYDDYYDDYYYYDYNNRENPCSKAYYSGKNITRNILASNIGLIVKRGNNGEISVFTSDLVSAKPLSNVVIEAYDFQQQKLKEVTTNSEGMASFTTKQKPFVLIAKHGQERNYIKLEDGNSLSLSSFDINGDEVQKGMKGFIYGERGVWRPGDSLYLSFILENKQGDVPANYPASLELENPQGQLVQKIIKTQHVNGFYSFATKTEASAPTGVYLAKVKVGGVTFTKNIRIETIMPNRLKINLAPIGIGDKKDKIYSADLNINSNLSVMWLHGAPGRNLETKIDLSLSQIPTEFKNYADFTFDNPTQNFYSETQTVFTGKTNDEGNVLVNAQLNDTKNAPGFLMANFTIRAFEEGGGFSTDRFTIPVSPFSHYVGIKTPETKLGNYYLETDSDHNIQLATLDEQGKPTNRKIDVKVYKLDWRWWWDNYNQDLSSYIGSNYHQPIYSQELVSSNGKANFKFRVNQPAWGRYLIYAKDLESGHACGKVVFVDWPSWAGKSPKGNEGSNVLTINTDKQEYKVGEKAKVLIPTSATGKVLVNIENGSHTVMSKWIDAKQGTTEFEFTVTKEMTPNIYVFTHFLQPHAQTINDLPIRMYGVASLMVKDENTILKPQIVTDAVWKPESKATVKVSEENDKEMAYTLAIVDEGLLDITRFKTPSPWDVFYAKEALGVKTWDVFDNVIGAFGNAMMRILSIGGDDALNAKPENSAKRFKPMVRFVGPFLLKKGETATHQIDIPQYVGSVRVMVVAGNKGAYGNAEKAVPIRKPLMILSTLPRVLSPNEEVDLSITIFAMEKKVKQAVITVTTDKYITQAPGGSSQTINFTSIGDKVIHFKLKTNELLGVSKITIQAKGAGEVATETIEIAVRANNPLMTNADEFVLTASKGLNATYAPLGLQGTNKAYVELSTLPAINLSQRLEYLVQYPHGCVEQTTSSVFAGLYLSDITDINPAYKSFIDKATKAAINRLKSFQTSSGGFAYWPNLNEADNWGTSYAGHFLLEAKTKGYTLPYGLIDNWKKYQKQKAQNYLGSKNATYAGEDLAQAYRLYTLALAGAAELGAMNRLKEDKKTSNEAKWRLAAAYALVGQMEVAKKMASTISTKATNYANYYYTYGSLERDDAMLLETMTLLKDNNNAFLKVKEMSVKLGNNDYWMSTQTTAYCLMAISKYAKLNNSNAVVGADVVIGNEKTSITDFTKTKFKLVEIKNPNTTSAIKVTVKGNGNVFARIVKQGIPKAGDETSKASNLQLSVVYKTLNGAAIDVANLEQGTDFVAEVTIKNPGMRGYYKNLALSQLFASGWEIRNQRLDNITYLTGDNPTYQDIRDDRVYSYFDLGTGQSKTFKIMLNASYNGKYYLPGVSCEAMYDNSISAHVAGKWVVVKRQGEVM